MLPSLFTSAAVRGKSCRCLRSPLLSTGNTLIPVLLSKSHTLMICAWAEAVLAIQYALMTPLTGWYTALYKWLGTNTWFAPMVGTLAFKKATPVIK